MSTLRFRDPKAALCVLVAVAFFMRSAPAVAQEVLEASVFAPEGMVGSMVGIDVDDGGRVLVTETARRTHGALDIRRHFGWLEDVLGFQSVDERRAYIREHYRGGALGDANLDGREDWTDLLVPTEKIIALEDTDGDGRADKCQVFAEGFSTEVTGLAGSVLHHRGSVYATIVPDLWKLDDTDGDGAADHREALLQGFGLHVGYGGHDMHGLTVGPDGKIYWSIGDKAFSVTSRERVNYHFPCQGAVFRCQPDGSDFEVFAKGVRNPQELAFNAYGDLFIVDNDGDFGDQERFHQVLPGSDSGWRTYYQYRTKKRRGETAEYNAWIAEKLWQPRFEGQAAYITPCLANFSEGPAGFTHNPGTALSEAFEDHFFLTEFPGKRLQAFRAEEAGAGYELVAPHVVLGGQMLVGINFGPDGALYAADWGDNAWEPHDKGRVLRIDVPTGQRHRLRDETQQLLKEDLRRYPVGALARLMSHADRRVRLKAQLEIVERGDFTLLKQTAMSDPKELGRIHALWGCAQMARDGGGSLQGLMILMKHDNPEIRAQLCRVLGETGSVFAVDQMVNALDDESPRVRLQAGLALHHLASEEQLPAIIAFVASNAGEHANLRHAGVRALEGAARGRPAALGELRSHVSPAVRLCAVVALRRLHEAREERKLPGDAEILSIVANYLADSDVTVVEEAARAIHDVIDPGSDALRGLAETAKRPGLTSDVILRRALNANRLLGGPEAARRLAAYGAKPSGPEDMRVEAIELLASWTSPQVLDHVIGFVRPRPAGERGHAQAALDAHLGGLLASEKARVQKAVAAAVEALEYEGAEERLLRLASDPEGEASLRGAALEALHALDADGVDDLLQKALESGDPFLRRTAQRLSVKRAPKSPATVDRLLEALATGALEEKQQVIELLARLKDSPEAREAIAGLVGQLETGSLAPELRLEVLEAAQALNEEALTERVVRYQASKPEDDGLAPYLEALHGGDAAEGESIFRGSVTAQCIRCHSLEGKGSAVGPSLAGVGKRLDRRQLLESMVDPQAAMAEGHGLVNVTLRNGETVAGAVKVESERLLTLEKPDGNVVDLPKPEILNRAEPVSTMPPMGVLLSLRELRDLVSYLAELNGEEAGNE